ncbi:WD-40 repeat protein [Reticulomyxa filosa]|uniref:WD-40 repeat protein n=1 Tax=Reticulomyxa filosa TaxID=46433 RepID=X6M3E5_RETFI|nr:WD-40 repeat protein [Reticulomyxa filosa]|eukprot:ETO07545.1 WD-40 repeat protein [Reticulomyxa filosa]
MTTSGNEKRSSSRLASLEEEIQVIIQYWIRILKIKLGWINDFDKIVANYAATFFMFNTFCSSSKLRKLCNGHNDCVNSIGYSTFDDNQLICSGSYDNTVRVWDMKDNKHIQPFNGHSDYVYCVKFSPYHYYNYCQNVICSSSQDKTISFWNFKGNQQLNTFNGHTNGICSIVFSQFNGGKYLCSGSYDKTIRLWNVETSKSLHIFKGHEYCVCCVEMSPLQSNSNNNESNNIGVIGGSGYTICSGSHDFTIRLWDIETANELILFKGHEGGAMSVKYGSNELGNIGGANTILSGSSDKSVCLWDIRSGQQIQMFDGHTNNVNAVEYSPFVVKNDIKTVTSNVICSGSRDNTIRFWDIRSNKNELYMIEGNSKEFEDYGIKCLTFVSLKKTKNNRQRFNDISLIYGLYCGRICVWR